MVRILFLWVYLVPSISFGHLNHKHPEAALDGGVFLNPYSQINRNYLSTIKPIFLRACFDCHSQSPKYPWYYKLPIVHTLIEGDRKAALEHLDMSYDFPFAGHGTPDEDLEAIDESIQKNEMPMLRYRIMHPSAAISVIEKIRISRWVKDSLKLLQKK